MENEGEKDKIKSNFYVTPAALEVIARRAPSTNKRGQWLSDALVDYDRILAGVPESIEARLRNLELMISRLILLAECKSSE
jgi:hypothetical protein